MLRQTSLAKEPGARFGFAILAVRRVTAIDSLAKCPEIVGCLLWVKTLRMAKAVSYGAVPADDDQA
jgi:hypothetical protein